MQRSTWFALFAPPFAWFAALTAAYFMVNWACGSAAGVVALHATIGGMALLSVGGGVAGFRSWRRTGREWPGESPDPATRTRFLSVIGTLGGVIFSAAILWFWIAALVLSPCEPGPRFRMAPSAMAAEGAPAPASYQPGASWNPNSQSFCGRWNGWANQVLTTT